MKEYLSKLRKDYGKNGLAEQDVDSDPIKQFEKWLTDAANYGILEPNAFVLSTCGADGRVSGRVVLLRNLDKNGLTFYTNYKSLKAQQIENNDSGAATFFWADIERQIRIEGKIRKISTMESMEYFKNRPKESQIGAWASPQSEVIPNRKWLEDRVDHFRSEFKNSDVPKPPFWGGYCLDPIRFEFWQGRPSRLHDRILYSLQDNHSWKIERLAP